MQREMAASRMLRLHYFVFWLRFLSMVTAKRISGVAFFRIYHLLGYNIYIYIYITYIYVFFSLDDRAAR